jgi:hypothetical protein
LVSNEQSLSSDGLFLFVGGDTVISGDTPIYKSNNDELYHYGVKGMKWGVRKSEYKSMNRQQRKETRKKYYKTPTGKVEKATRIGTVLAGPLGGVIAGSIMNKKVGGISPKTVEKGKNEVEKLKPESVKTESKKVADIKSRVTGKKENGKPAFLWTPEEHDAFTASYNKRMATLSKQYKNTSDAATKKRLSDEMDRVMDDYESIVTQDFWYTDD